MYSTDIDQERFAWSSEKVEQLILSMDEGYKPKSNPFYEGNPIYKKGNILFDYGQEEIDELTKCANDIVYFANNYCTVMTDDGLQTIKARDYQEKLLYHYVDNRFTVVLASRQVGKTITASIFIAWYVLFNVDRNVLVLSNKGDTTKEIVDKSKVILDNLPFFMKPGILKNDVFNMKFDNGCRIVAQSTTKNAGISFTIHLLFLDEFAHIHPNIVKSFYENVYPTLSSSKVSRIIITSTPNGPNKFFDIYDQAMKNKNEYAPFRIDWWQVPGRDEEWMKREVQNLGSEEAFNKQYGNLFFSDDNLLLGPEDIKKIVANQLKYEPHDFEDLDDTEVKYRNYLKWHPEFDTDDTLDENNYWAFSVDIAEGKNRDYSIINIFKVRTLENHMFKHLTQPGSYADFFYFDQVALFRSNEHSIEEFAKILYTLMYDIFYSENVKVVIEWNAFGGELLKNLSTVFPQRNDFDEENIVKFKHRMDARVAQFGLKLRPDNKMILCQKFKKYVAQNRIRIYEYETVEEAKSFGKMPNGKFQALMGHDDAAMSSINLSEFFDTMDYSDFVEELYENVQEEEQKKIEEEIEKGAKGDGSLYYDIYALLDGESDIAPKKDNIIGEDDLDFIN